MNAKAKNQILVIGDLICDAHHFLDYGGTSSETGGVLGLYKKTKITWGGAGLVVRNILALNGRVAFVSWLGDDEYALKVDGLEDNNLQKVFFKEKGRQTVVKERYLIGGKKVLRVNRGDSQPISHKASSAVIKFVKINAGHFGKILIADYRHGLLDEALAKKIIAETKKRRVPVFVDSQVVRGESNHFWYKGAHLICLNQKEALSVDPKFNENNLVFSLKRLKSMLSAENIIVKLGKNGSASLLGEEFFETPALKLKAVDTIGAGDAFLAALAVSPNLNKDAISFANKWAGLAVTVQGTEPPKLADLKK